MKKWTNKYTKKVNIFPDDWSNPKNNFTEEARSAEAISGCVEDEWNEVTQTWDISQASQEAYDNKTEAIAALKASPIFIMALSDLGAVVDERVVDADLNFIIKHQVKAIKGIMAVLEVLIKDS